MGKRCERLQGVAASSSPGLALGYVSPTPLRRTWSSWSITCIRWSEVVCGSAGNCLGSRGCGQVGVGLEIVCPAGAAMRSHVKHQFQPAPAPPSLSKTLRNWFLMTCSEVPRITAISGLVCLPNQRGYFDFAVSQLLAWRHNSFAPFQRLRWPGSRVCGPV
jgi:hypothetical protein